MNEIRTILILKGQGHRGLKLSVRPQTTVQCPCYDHLNAYVFAALVSDCHYFSFQYLENSWQGNKKELEILLLPAVCDSSISAMEGHDVKWFSNQSADEFHDVGRALNLQFNLTTRVGWLLSFQLTFPSWSAIVVIECFCSVFVLVWLCTVCCLVVIVIRLCQISSLVLGVKRYTVWRYTEVQKPRFGSRYGENWKRYDNGSHPFLFERNI